MSAVRLNKREATHHYGREKTEHFYQRGDDSGDESEEGEGSSDESTAFEPSGAHPAYERRGSGRHSETTTLAATVVRSRTLEQQAPENPWDPAIGEAHHVSITFEVRRRRRELSFGGENGGVITVKTDHGVDSFIPHTFGQIDKHIGKLQARTAADWNLSNIVVVGVEHLGISASTLQSFGVRSKDVPWLNTSRHANARDGMLFSVPGDPNGRGRVQLLSESTTVVDNTDLMNSKLYAKYAHVDPTSVKDQWRGYYVGDKLRRLDIRAKSDIHDVIVDRQHKFEDFDISELEVKDGWIRGVPASILLPVVKMLLEARGHVRTVDVRNGLEFEIFPINAEALESTKNTIFEKRFEDEDEKALTARTNAYLETFTTIRFTLCFHYMVQVLDLETKQRRKAGGEKKRELGDEEKRQLLLTGAPPRRSSDEPSRRVSEEPDFARSAWRA